MSRRTVRDRCHIVPAFPDKRRPVGVSFRLRPSGG